MASGFGRRLIGATVLIHALAVPARAQWKEFPTPGLPRTADGKPDLAALPPRLRDGKPDLSGVWRIRQGTYFIYITSALKSGDIQPWAQAKYEERARDFRRDSNGIRCLPPGPNAATSGVGLPLKIVQTPDVVVILYEYQTLYRQIFTDARPLPDDPNPTWMGYSVGRWDGDTLVATTRGYNDRTMLDLAGHPHSEALTVTERFKRTDVGHIQLQVTFDDPKAYNRSWTVPIDLDLMPDSELIEYICENERDAPHLVGTRGDEFEVPLEILREYVGTYESGRGVLVVTLEDGRLMVELNGAGRIPLFAHSETAFTMEGTGIRFERDAGGVVTKLVQSWTESDRAFVRKTR